MVDTISARYNASEHQHRTLTAKRWNRPVSRSLHAPVRRLHHPFGERAFVHLCRQVTFELK